MEGDSSHRHRQRALESLTRNSISRPRSSIGIVGHGALDSGHSIWSDDAISTRHITLHGGFDSRFNNVDLGNSTPTARAPARPFSVNLTGPNNGTAEVLWTAHDADAESQYSTDTLTEPQGKVQKILKAFRKKIKGRYSGTPVTWKDSTRALVKFSWLNVLLIFVPIAWGVHYAHVSHIAKFFLCFVAIMPLSKILDFGGEQLALYCGRTVGDLIVITLNNAVEASLAIVLLAECQLKLLQSTVTGVVVLRLLLVPGFAFITGGARIITQDLHPQIVQLNTTLLTIGALTLLIPAAFFSALDRSISSSTDAIGAEIDDSIRGDFLKLSRGLAVFLLIVYVSSRVYLHNPPGKNDDLQQHLDAPAAFKVDAERLNEEKPLLNPAFCIFVLMITVVLLGVTSEFLLSSIRPLSQRGIRPEFFGMVLLPFTSYSADGILSIVYFVRRHFTLYRGGTTTMEEITELAQGRSIDLGIQFLLFWMPFLVLIAWFIHKPLSLLFDVFEVAVLLGACFLVNQVTADSKTNWVEGLMMVTLYSMAVLTTWFYPGQTDIQYMVTCGTVKAAIENGPTDGFIFAKNPENPPLTNQMHTTQAVNSKNGDDKTLNEGLQKMLRRYNILKDE